MIEFKVLSAPDRMQLGNYSHTGGDLVLGRSEGDMLLDDPALSPRQIRIRQDGAGFVVENLDPKVEIRLNGKPVQGAMPIRDRDNIVAGKTTLNFLRLDSRPPVAPEPYIHPQAHNRFVDGSKEKALLDGLDYLAKEGSAPPPSRGPTAPPASHGLVQPPPLPGGVKPPLPPTPPRKV